MTRDRLHLSVPHMSGTEQKYIADAFASNWLSSVGPNLDAFEHAIEQRLGGDVHALAVSSGTAALHLILRAAGVSRGDRVAVSTLTFAGSVWPILYLGAEPVFIDSENSSGNIDPDLVEEHFSEAAKRNELPRVLIAVHLYGQHADIDRIADTCLRYGVTLVEDAAESLGATYKGRETGTTAPYALLSFNGNKIITTTGGGMVLAKDELEIQRMKKWANQSRENAVEYLHRELGYNYRMSNVLAGIGRGQLEVLDDRVARRRLVAARYAAAFAGRGDIVLQAEAPWGTHTRWLTVMYLTRDASVSNRDIIAALDEHNIDSRPVWRPMHTQPLFASMPAIGGAVAERLFAAGICLPSSSSLSEDDQNRVIDVACKVLQRPRTKQRRSSTVRGKESGVVEAPFAFR